MLSCATERLILEPGTASGPPPASELDAAALELRRRGEIRLLIGLVERWHQVGRPTDRAQLAQIEALLDLCMMDRAWTRLQAPPGIGADRLLRWKLTARMFLARGWPSRAQDAIDHARALDPNDDELPALAEAAARPAVPPPAAPPDAHEPLRVQIRAAEAWLSSGAYLKARRLLETLERQYPGHARVSDLLWALRGEYDLQGASLSDIVGRFMGSVTPGDEHDDITEQTDVSIDLEDGDAAFPGLFRGDNPSVDDVDLGDIEDTQATDIGAFLEQIPDTLDHGREEDTQVLRVIGEDAEVVDAEAERVSDVDELEEEDEVVVLLRPGALHAPPRANRPLPLPPTPPRQPRRAKAAPELVPHDPAPAPAPPPATPAAAPAPAPQAGRVAVPTTWILASAAVLGASGLMVLLTVLWALTRPA